MLPKSFSIQNFSILNPCYLMKRIPTVCSTNLYWDRLFRHRLYRDRLYRDRFSPRPFVLRIFGCVLDAYVTYSIYIFIISVAKIFGFSSLVSFSSSIFHNDLLVFSSKWYMKKYKSFVTSMHAQHTLPFFNLTYLSFSRVFRVQNYFIWRLRHVKSKTYKSKTHLNLNSVLQGIMNTIIDPKKSSAFKCLEN